jgi:NhaP-type Na+/H+ or K+/H+ antiporter
VFGESVLNDAVAIALYRALCGFLERPVSVASSFDALGQFLIIFVGSLIVGVLVALASSLVRKIFETYCNFK